MANTVTVLPVSSRQALRRFIDFQYDHYRGNRSWIAPLRREVVHTLTPAKNAFFEHGKIQPFIATDGSGRVVGRVAAIINGMHLRKYDDGNGFFGFFESIDDYDVASALLHRAAEWLREQGMRGMRGPTNPSLNDMAGLLVDGFDRQPSILMPYNWPYYAGFLERFGFERAMTMWAYYVHKKYVRTAKLRRGVEIVKQRNPGLKLRTIDMDRFDDEARTILRIYNEAWSQNWGHVPMTENEFAALAKLMKQVVDPSIVFVVEDNGTPVAFSISLPNLNMALRHVDGGGALPLVLPKLLAFAKFGGVYECRNLLMGVLPPYKGRGLDAVMNLELMDRGPENGYDACEMSWVLDTNAVLKNSLDAMGAVVDKEYALYERPL